MVYSLFHHRNSGESKNYNDDDEDEYENEREPFAICAVDDDQA